MTYNTIQLLPAKSLKLVTLHKSMTSEGNVTEITAGKGEYMLIIDGVIIKIAIG